MKRFIRFEKAGLANPRGKRGHKQAQVFRSVRVRLHARVGACACACVYAHLQVCACILPNHLEIAALARHYVTTKTGVCVACHVLKRAMASGKILKRAVCATYDELCALHITATRAMCTAYHVNTFSKELMCTAHHVNTFSKELHALHITSIQAQLCRKTMHQAYYTRIKIWPTHFSAGRVILVHCTEMTRPQCT